MPAHFSPPTPRHHPSLLVPAWRLETGATAWSTSRSAMWACAAPVIKTPTPKCSPPTMKAAAAAAICSCVCDGMGAHAAGELASQMAVDGIPHTYLKLADQPAPDALRKSIVEANHQIHHRGQANIDFQGMGTTASVLALLPQGALVAHVGDSRVYRLRGQRLDQLTFDHSLVWEMSAAGQVPKDALPGFVPKNIITRSLGPHAEVQVDLEGPFPLGSGRHVPVVQRRPQRPGQRRRNRRAVAMLAPGRRHASADRPGQSARRARQHHHHGRASKKPRRLRRFAGTVGHRCWRRTGRSAPIVRRPLAGYCRNFHCRRNRSCGVGAARCSIVHRDVRLGSRLRCNRLRIGLEHRAAETYRRRRPGNSLPGPRCPPGPRSARHPRVQAKSRPDRWPGFDGRTTPRCRPRRAMVGRLEQVRHFRP